MEADIFCHGVFSKRDGCKKRSSLIAATHSSVYCWVGARREMVSTSDLASAVCAVFCLKLSMFFAFFLVPGLLCDLPTMGVARVSQVFGKVQFRSTIF